jgi:hypothetical protein
MVNFFIRGGLDYVWMKRCPEGIAGEVFSFDALAKICMDHPEPLEFLTYHLKTTRFHHKEFYPPKEYQYSFRLTMDYPEDLTLLRIVHKMLPEPIGTLDIVNLLRKNKYLLSINHQPKVTVYSVNHNYGRYSIDAIRSVLDQTYQDYEYIYYDDASTDGSVNMVTEYVSGLKPEQRDKIKILRSRENIGLTAGCNRVLSEAKGKYIIRLDSDDWMDDKMLQTMVDTIDTMGVDCVFSAFREVAENGMVKLIDSNPKHPACCLLSRNVVNELKYREGLKYFDGLDFFKRFEKLYRYTFVREPLWYYRRHDGQKTDPVNDAEREKIKKAIEGENT